MKDHHYVVVWNEKSGWSIGAEMEEGAFPNGTIYDHDTDEWDYAYKGDGEWEENEQDLTEQLQDILETHNTYNGKAIL